MSSSNASSTSTRAYLQADLAQTRAEANDITVALAAMASLRARLQKECPGVLAGEPKPAKGATLSASAQLIDEELTAGVLGVAEHTELARRRSFARAVAHLTWQSRSLTELVHSYVLAEVAQAQATSPNLCADLRSWVASGFQSVPASSESYVRRESALTQQTDAGERILSKLAPYEDPADAALARQILAIEKQAVQMVAPKLLLALGQIAEVLHGPAAVPAS